MADDINNGAPASQDNSATEPLNPTTPDKPKPDDTTDPEKQMIPRSRLNEVAAQREAEKAARVAAEAKLKEYELAEAARKAKAEEARLAALSEEDRRKEEEAQLRKEAESAKIWKEEKEKAEAEARAKSEVLEKYLSSELSVLSESDRTFINTIATTPESKLAVLAEMRKAGKIDPPKRSDSTRLSAEPTPATAAKSWDEAHKKTSAAIERKTRGR